MNLKNIENGKRKIMVYNAKTYKVLHKLTKEGEEHYKELLEKAADQILYTDKHPIKAFIKKYILKEFV